jgi:glycine reductase complex component B subunit alpha and beta
MMTLELGSFPVEHVQAGSPGGYADGTLTVDVERLRARCLEDPRVVEVEVDMVEPGEPTRIVHVRDVIEPRVKVAGEGHAYPAICGHAPDTVGDGVTHRFEGFALLVAADVPDRIRREVSAAADSIIDMSGPGAVTAYSALRYVSLTFRLEPALELVEWNETLRAAAHRAADQLAGCLRELEPPARRRFALDPVGTDLPRVVHVHTLNGSMVPGIGSTIYGYARHALPLLLHPNEILDGAIAGDAVVTYPGKCSWIQVNNPVLPQLYAHHGRDFEWLGSIVARTRWGGAAEKELSAFQTVKLAQMLRADGALVTWNHGGNDLIEVMLTIQGLERAGIKTVFLTIESDIKVVRMIPELAETGAHEPPLLFSVPEADAIVSTGTLAPETALPAMERVVGGDTVAFDFERPDVRASAAGPLDLEELSGAYSPIFGHFDNYGLGTQSYFDY